MSTGSWAGLVLCVLGGSYGAFVVALIVVGRRETARAVACFVPNCTVLLGRLLREPGLPRRRGLVLGLVAAYLATPIDLVPDLIPVIGYLDDAIVVALTLRWLLKTADRDRLTELWPGPPSSLASLLKAAGVPASAAGAGSGGPGRGGSGRRAPAPAVEVPGQGGLLPASPQAAKRWRKKRSRSSRKDRVNR